MASPSEADTDAAHLGGAHLHPSEPLSKQMKTEPSQVGSEKKEAAETLPVNSSQAFELSSFQEKQDRDAKLMQEKHATMPLCVPELQASNAPIEGDVAIKKKSTPSSERKTVEPRSLDTSLEKKGPEMPMVRREPSEASSTDYLRSGQTGSTGNTDGVKFATSSNGQELSFTKAIIDTAAPFESVKEAVTMFGERTDRKLQSQALEEKMVSPVFDIHKASEEIVQCKEKLALEEASIRSALSELQKTKEKICLCKGDVPVTTATEGGSSPSNQPEEVSSVDIAKDLHMNVLRELDLAQKEIEDVLKEQLQMEALRQSTCEDNKAAMSAQNKASMSVQDLMKEYASRRESLEAAKGALAVTEADISSLQSISNVTLKASSGVEALEVLDPRLASLDMNVTHSEASVEKLLKELGTMRGVQVNITEGEFLGAKVRLEQAKIAEGNQMAALGRVLEQLDETKLNLKKAIDEGASLPSTIGALQREISNRRAELDGAHETEQIACATLASLQDELCSVRAKVLSAQAGEAKAREAKRTLPAGIKQLAVDADEAKAASNLAREEARKGRLEVVLAKAGISATLSKVQAAQKEAEAARASEAMALAEFKALSESDGELAGKITVSISFKEYRGLHDAGQEAEEAANKKVAVILMQVEAATVSQQEAQGKLDIVLKDLEMLGKAMEEARKKADDAEAAKLSVEAELRKWRAEHEQWRKFGSSNPSSVSTSAAQSPRFLNGKGSQVKTLSHSFQGKAVAGLDSLAEVLTLKVPNTEKAAKVMPEVELPKKSAKFKKVSFFARVLSILVGKKNKAVT